MDGPLEIAGRRERDGEVVARFKEVRLETERAIQQLDRLSGVALLLLHEAKGVPGFGVIRRKRQVFFEGGEGGFGVAFVVQQRAEVKPGIRKLRPKADRHFELTDSAFHIIARRHFETLLKVRGCGIGGGGRPRFEQQKRRSQRDQHE
jgi:hypothetical protein